MVNKKIEKTRPKKSEKEPQMDEKEEIESPLMEGNDVQQDKEQNAESEDLLGKRPFLNPLNALMMQNLNQTHQNQRKRDIKQNYKAKLPLDKLIQEHEKKKQQLVELLEKKASI